MSLDIILYAVVAAVLLVRLWSVFGRRNDEDHQRPNPFVAPPQPAPETKAVKLDQGMPKMLAPLQAAPDSLAGGLEQIKKNDPSFNEKSFLQGARSAFTMIVEDFAKGDLTRIGRLLGPNVLPRFQNAIEERNRQSQTLESRIIKIRDAETAVARVDGTTATITVRFVSEQNNLLRDNFGRILSGEAGQNEEITDLWTFARDTKAADPNWILVETKS